MSLMLLSLSCLARVHTHVTHFLWSCLSVSGFLLSSHSAQCQRCALTSLCSPPSSRRFAPGTLTELLYGLCVRSPRDLKEWEKPFLEMSLFWESRSCWEVFWLVHVSRLSAGFSSPWQQPCLRATMAPWLRRSVRICWERRTRMELTWSETARPSRGPCVFVSSEYSAPRSQAPYTRLPFIKTSFF